MVQLEAIVVPADLFHHQDAENEASTDQVDRNTAKELIVLVIQIFVFLGRIVEQIGSPQDESEDRHKDVGVANNAEECDQTSVFGLTSFSQDFEVKEMYPLDHAQEAPIHFAQHVAENVQLNEEQDAHLEPEPIELDACVSGLVPQKGSTGVFTIDIAF